MVDENVEAKWKWHFKILMVIAITINLSLCNEDVKLSDDKKQTTYAQVDKAIKLEEYQDTEAFKDELKNTDKESSKLCNKDTDNDCILNKYEQESDVTYDIEEEKQLDRSERHKEHESSLNVGESNIVKHEPVASESNISIAVDNNLDETNFVQVISEDTASLPVETINNNKTLIDPFSSYLYWFKYILEPLIEEFKDGIYPKLNEKVNVSVANISLDIQVVNATKAIDVNQTAREVANITSDDEKDSNKKVKFHCTGRNVTDNANATVKLITTAQLLQMLNFERNGTENVTADCLLVMFYAPWCHFCAKTAPNYNALARAFPQLDFVAVDTAQFSNLLARFGTVSVPNILVFHQSRAAVKFNQTERTFFNFVNFVTNTTGLEANTNVSVTEIDFVGPVPSIPTNEPDYLLVVSWIFVIFCSSVMLMKSNKGQQWINRVKILWQEHQHID